MGSGEGGGDGARDGGRDGGKESGTSSSLWRGEGRRPLLAVQPYMRMCERLQPAGGLSRWSFLSMSNLASSTFARSMGFWICGQT